MVAEIHRDVVSLAGWTQASAGGRRVAWRIEVYGESPQPIEVHREIAERLLSGISEIAAGIDRARLGEPQGLSPALSPAIASLPGPDGDRRSPRILDARRSILDLRPAKSDDDGA